MVEKGNPTLTAATAKVAQQKLQAATGALLEAKEHERPSDVPPAPPNSLPAPAILPPPRLPQPAIRAEVGGGQSRLAATSLAVVALTDIIRI